jgi:acetylornithine/N-succinyldiaminopimelate aminotransferase
MNTKQIAELYAEYILPTYTQLPVCLIKGKGSKVWDVEQKEYIDFFPGWGVSGLGHCNPNVVNAIKHQAKKILHISNNFYNLKQAQLAELISKSGFPSKSFFCNSGTEANEAAIKFARKYGSKTNRYEIITFRKSFHGRTMGSMVATAQEKIQQGFEPLLQGFKYADFNDLASVKKQLSDQTIAIMLEPVQGEGGINVATPEFMKALRVLCDEKDMLLILDEVQTCGGRTGKLFAYQHYDMEPDLMTLAKAIGGGVPIGALVVHKNKAEGVLTPGTHGSTFGGNPLVAVAAIAVIKTILSEGLLDKAEKIGVYLNEKLEELRSKYSEITQVRGLGMMCALEFQDPAGAVAEEALKRGLLINCTQEKILRIMPPITISKTLLDEGLHILEEAIVAAAKRKEGIHV